MTSTEPSTMIKRFNPKMALTKGQLHRAAAASWGVDLTTLVSMSPVALSPIRMKLRLLAQVAFSARTLSSTLESTGRYGEVLELQEEAISITLKTKLLGERATSMQTLPLKKKRLLFLRVSSQTLRMHTWMPIWSIIFISQMPRSIIKALASKPKSIRTTTNRP